MSQTYIWWYEAMDCDQSDESCYSRWKDIHIAAIIPSFISLCCSIYIICMTIIYLKQFRKITFGATLPMFISICDAIFHSCHGGDHLHNLITSHIPPGGWCLFLGSMKQFSINGQTSWAIATAYFINYCVRNQEQPSDNYRYFNTILHIICWGTPSVVLICGYIFNVYGKEGPWCGIKDHQHDLLMVDLWVLIADGVLIALYSWTFVHIYKQMKSRFKTDEKTSAIRDNEAADRSLDKIKKVMRTLPWFPVVYVVQWSLYLSWKLHFLAQTLVATMFVVTVTNMGGMFNMIVFYRLLMNPVRQQQRRQKRQSSSVTSSV
eukprot:226384_1